MNDYSKLEYWEKRYSENSELFEWYQIYPTIAKSLEIFHINKSEKVLHIGAGTSKLSEHMFHDGFRNITEIDFSPTVVRLMNERYREIGLPIKYQVMDVTDMKDFQDNEFGFIIDKGTLDSILCGEFSYPTIEKMLREVFRLLGNKGIFVCVSYGERSRRELLFTSINWDINVIKVPKPTAIMKTDIEPGVEEDSKNYHYIYVMKKNETKTN